MQITKIVITGGPCAGKSTAMNWIQNTFAAKGYTVLFIPETATEFISGGVAPWTCGTNCEYQKVQMKLQLSKEQFFDYAARTMRTEKVLIVCDRGALDNKAYMNEQEFAEVLQFVGQTEQALLDHYDAVFHLVTAADGAAEYYSNATNAIRYESVQEAVALDQRLFDSWKGHSKLCKIDNSTGFTDKMRRLMDAIAAFLGEQGCCEICRNYLIEMPDIHWLSSQPDCHKTEIVMTWLKISQDEEIRLCCKSIADRFIYSHTHKRALTSARRLCTEHRLTEREYAQRLEMAGPTPVQLKKTRYSLTIEGQPLFIDIYPFMDQAVAEIMLSSEEADYHMPSTFRIIKDVTNEPSYRNAALAQTCQNRL